MSELNQNQNSFTESGDENASLAAMFQDYNNKQAGRSADGKLTKEELKAKVFTTRNPKETFRILPPKKGRNFYETAHFHVVRISGSGGEKQWRKIYCPQHNDPPQPALDANGQLRLDLNGNPILVPAKCPLCEKAEMIKAKQTKAFYDKDHVLTPEEEAIKKKNSEIFKEYNALSAKLFYIVKGIDKGAGKDGPKFWRFKENYKKQGVFDKLMPCLEHFYTNNNVDFANPDKGTDLSITVIDTKMPTGQPYKEVSTILSGNQSKLHEDPIIVKQWVEDTLTWRDVFKPATAPNITSYEFLEMIASGTEPYWDDTNPSNKHWVFPGRPDLEAKANTRTTTHAPSVSQPVDLTTNTTDMGAKYQTPPTQQAVQSTIEDDHVVEEVDNDDLPF